MCVSISLSRPVSSERGRSTSFTISKLRDMLQKSLVGKLVGGHVCGVVVGATGVGGHVWVFLGGLAYLGKEENLASERNLIYRVWDWFHSLIHAPER